MTLGIARKRKANHALTKTMKGQSFVQIVRTQQTLKLKSLLTCMLRFWYVTECVVQKKATLRRQRRLAPVGSFAKCDELYSQQTAYCIKSLTACLSSKVVHCTTKLWHVLKRSFYVDHCFDRRHLNLVERGCLLIADTGCHSIRTAGTDLTQ